ncbi:FAD:protein FMN transferase [Marivita hallyeonensis]|uniref:FAD:protein FMN transferase n=1 Tax=Marivita hallyeonensis TaxID=996342 RepID=A0A1M5NJ08_9RHOB|nr:FAD:protein FMN transferase [Marivita hallyeonensis]SHG89199.1 thiamine biosynthesis lipoprotein [Marivita hallyeonensis]
MTHRSHGLSRRHVLGCIGATLALPNALRASQTNMIQGTAFGTHWRVMASTAEVGAEMTRRVDAICAEVDQQFSPWRPDSLLSRFNHGGAGDRLSEPDVLTVTAAALDIARKSDGAFDPTVGPLVARWGFGPITEGGAADWRALDLTETDLSKNTPDLTLDLCGIAKGWALDRIAHEARRSGHDNLLFDLGGEFVALGQHPDGRDWQIAIEPPIPGAQPHIVLRLPPGMAVATSGTAAQSYSVNGRLYSHIIDPVTGTPATGRLRSVTVAAADAMTADGWATALFVAGDIAGPDLARTHQIDAVFQIEAEGTLRDVRTGSVSGLIL